MSKAIPFLAAFAVSAFVLGACSSPPPAADIPTELKIGDLVAEGYSVEVSNCVSGLSDGLRSGDSQAQLIEACERAGIPRARIAIDPGIGFGKTDPHNLRLLSEAAVFQGLGCAVVVGASRKSFIGRLAGIEDPDQRLPGSLVAAALAAAEGANILRVHDVAETRQALTILESAHAGR